MEVIYICCDEGEVGACDEEDRRKLEALAGHTPSAGGGRSKAVKCEAISDLDIEKSGDKLPNGNSSLEDPINNYNGKNVFTPMQRRGEIRNRCSDKEENHFFPFVSSKCAKNPNDL